MKSNFRPERFKYWEQASKFLKSFEIEWLWIKDFYFYFLTDLQLYSHLFRYEPFLSIRDCKELDPNFGINLMLRF